MRTLAHPLRRPSQRFPSPRAGGWAPAKSKSGSERGWSRFPVATSYPSTLASTMSSGRTMPSASSIFSTKHAFPVSLGGRWCIVQDSPQGGGGGAGTTARVSIALQGQFFCGMCISCGSGLVRHNVLGRRSSRGLLLASGSGSVFAHRAFALEPAESAEYAPEFSSAFAAKSSPVGAVAGTTH